MLAMVVNDDAGHLMPCGVFRFFASKLAPTGGCCPQDHGQYIGSAAFASEAIAVHPLNRNRLSALRLARRSDPVDRQGNEPQGNAELHNP